jgi:hypothetical protein
MVIVETVIKKAHRFSPPIPLKEIQRCVIIENCFYGGTAPDGDVPINHTDFFLNQVNGSGRNRPVNMVININQKLLHSLPQSSFLEYFNERSANNTSIVLDCKIESLVLI